MTTLRAVIIFFAIVLSLEVALRILKGELFRFDHLLSRKIYLLRSSYPVAYHPELGWIPKYDPAVSTSPWLGKKITILENTCRANGNTDRPASLSAVAVLSP